MANVDVPLERLSFGKTSRRDAWWLAPLLTVIGLGVGFGYLTWGLLQPTHYWTAPYLTPLASPLLFGEGPHAWFGPDKPSWWPGSLPLIPGIFILWFPGGFRFTCYYYRGAYYKAFWADPLACTVGEPRTEYRGENKLPLILQNVHRYFLYFALIFLVFLGYDVAAATRFPTDQAPSQSTFGIGLGTIIMAANLALIGCYTFSCHSLRHLLGGRLDLFSPSPGRKALWDCASCLNRRHGLWAWLSLYSMCLTDIYIRLVSAGVMRDWRIF
jgi:hypothetical protein